MSTRQHWRALVVVAVGFALPACTDETHASQDKQSPAVVTEIDGTDFKEVTLTEQAVERIGLVMGAVSESSGTKTVPYAAVVYDQHGATFVYTSPRPLTFVRSPITVLEIGDDTASLTDGPDAGTEVVIVGTAQLFGAEQGIGY